MDYLWIFMAFSLGFAAKQLNLPPLLGYLVAGFALHAYGVEPGPWLEVMAELGVTLLLFTVGLKLNIFNTFKPNIIVGTFSHMGLMVLLSASSLMFFGLIGLSSFTDTDIKIALIIGFALSFSSTVVAVKMLESRNEMKTEQGQLALSVLILQDIAAVLFITFTTNQIPSIYAIGLLGLPLLKPILSIILKKSGHDEILILSGFFLAFCGAWLFKEVGLKGELGALAFGILLSQHSKAHELAKSLLHFKDIFLIGFFLSIGFYALPTVDMMIMSLIFTLSIPVKYVFYFLIFSLLKVRVRTSFLTAASLSSYSEFGLIVIAISAQQGLIGTEWIVIVALATALSFVLSGLVNINTHIYYVKFRKSLKRFERNQPYPKNYKQPKGMEVIVVGMGRVGSGAYDEANKETKGKVLGIDFDKSKVDIHKNLGRNVVVSDFEDIDFWEKVDLKSVKYIMLALPSVSDILNTVKILKLIGYKGKITSVAKFEDERKELIDAGI